MKEMPPKAEVWAAREKVRWHQRKCRYRSRKDGPARYPLGEDRHDPVVAARRQAERRSALQIGRIYICLSARP
jgi:hypothetical protein